MHAPIRPSLATGARSQPARSDPSGDRQSDTPLDRLAALVREQRGPLLEQWRKQVRELPAARDLDIPTLNDHIPELLEELTAELHSRSEQTIPAALSESSAPSHGRQRLKDGFDIQEVLAEYNVL